MEKDISKDLNEIHWKELRKIMDKNDEKERIRRERLLEYYKSLDKKEKVNISKN